MKSAMIVPLGTFLKVDSEPFTKKMTEDYKPTPQNVLKAFKLCNDFNLGLDRDEFQKQIFTVLNIPQEHETLFWEEWNKMLDLTDFEKNLKSFKEEAKKNGVLPYIIADTNIEHRREIERKVPDVKIVTSTDKKTMIDDMLSFLSYEQKKDRMALHGIMLETIKGKEFKTTEKTTLIIFGDPKNNKNELLQKKAEAELASIQSLANQSNATVFVHNISEVPFDKLLEQVFPSEPKVEKRPLLSVA